MDFYLRQMEKGLLDARQALANFIGTTAPNLAFVDNATYGMNVVANSFELQVGDEVLLNDHEYGAVFRIWQQACDAAGAKLVMVKLPPQIQSTEEVIAALLAGVTEKTKLLIVSHITSPTALILPIKEICSAFAQRDIPVCVDGPHAPAQVDLNIDELGCDFYVASLHKWLCATLGTGFLFVHPRWQERVRPLVTSWGRLLPAMPETWDEEFLWAGSREPSGFLTVPVAIDFLERIGLKNFQGRSRWLAQYAENALVDLFKTQPIGDRRRGWYGSMAHVPLPPGDWSNLQSELWQQVGIEVMINRFGERWFVRVSGHLYNNTTQIDTLTKALFRLTR